MLDYCKTHCGTIVGTAGGTLLSIVTHLGGELIRTAASAAIGAFVSFVVSFCLQAIVKHWKK
jgi:hypothetical protein